VRVLLINVPHPSIGSRIPDDHLPPLGLLAIGGPLIDDGHEVRLIDAEFGPMQTDEIVSEARRFAPDAVLFGHSGSTSGHPVIAEVARAIARAMPQALIIYGGVFPTYHWCEILAEEPYVTAIVRGEGEETARQLMRALEFGHRLDGVAGIAFSEAGRSRATRPAPVIRNLDAYRIGWELIDQARYSYWGGLRAVVVQFSRGCPHLCNYCGQRGFWTRWRHRDPVRFAKELARLKPDARTLKLIRKGATTATDREAIRLMRKHGILSMATWVVGFEEETDRDQWRGMRQLLAYDPDQIQMLMSRRIAGRRISGSPRRVRSSSPIGGAGTTSIRCWRRGTCPWRVLVWFKFTEMVLQCRPKALWRVYVQRDKRLRHAMRWYTQMGRRVWPYEILNFLRDRLLKAGPTVAEFWGALQDGEEESMSASGADLTFAIPVPRVPHANVKSKAPLAS